MFNLSSKKHYLMDQFKGYKNEYSVIVRDIEATENTLILDLKVNHTDDIISRYEMMEATVIYNLVNDTYTIKATGKGSRKHSYNIKHTVTIVIDHLVSEANKTYNTDCSEVNGMTIDYICNQLKNAGATTQQTNEMYYNINHTYNTVSEVMEAFNKLMNELTKVAEVNENNQTIQYFEVGNRTFKTYAEAELYCIESDFDPELMIIEAATSEPLSNSIIEQEPTEVYYVYNTTFNTYSEAYNHCIVNDYPVTMILSSLHKTMNTERLQELELQYKFSKHNMSILDMKEYYDYIMIQPTSTDKEDRYYKLKSWIERYENKQKSIETKKQHERQMAEQINTMITDLYSIGMIKKEYEHSTVTFYYLNNELIYNWSSGISTEKMYNELTEVHNRYYLQRKAV